MIDFYYWPTPNGWKVAILLEELGTDYRMIPVNISKGDQFEPGFLAISPNNRMPAIVDHDSEPPFTVFESGAIMWYLADKHGQFLPEEPVLRKEVMEWMFWQGWRAGTDGRTAQPLRELRARGGTRIRRETLCGRV